MAQNSQIKVSLMFDANTSRAKASLKDLQTSLNNVTKNITTGEFPMTNQIQEAYVAAEKLKKVLNQSVNMQTGQFDLSKFQAQLKQSGMSVQTLSADFAKLGPQGVQAFGALTSAISNAEIPIRRVNALVDNMAKSLKQTMQWQISSSVIHGFTGALQSAYGYAQDLNRSLNDIRIVTGESMDFMGRFADEANRAAKALSTSTNEYAKASLIFYQQGLDEQEVAKRTAATIKMANVTGENASEISSYMTAIWNNFDKGTKSLEYYADAMTALGAATASSTEEIATGMQQFASVAETVGLSYEYAASALATVVSATRQSEETVGTSFKTIFARLSSLSLGETLEDGTNLTKYSAALSAVGVNIKEGNGELKSMDKILDELGHKWNNISREQQNALAYTVAGTRQYNNFISLLDNYEKFKINVDIAMDSEGTLNEQQKIYEESWKAAANRVKAATEDIFQDLIDDDFFIALLDGFEKVLSLLDQFIDSIGGLPGVLSLVSGLMLKIFGNQAAESIRNISYGLKSFLGVAAAEAGQTKTQFLDETKKLIARTRTDIGGDPALQSELISLERRAQLEQEYLSLEDKLTDKQKAEYNLQLQLLDVLRQQNKAKATAVDSAEKSVITQGSKLLATATNIPADEKELQAWEQDKAERVAEAIRRREEAREALEQSRTNATNKALDVDKRGAELEEMKTNRGVGKKSHEHSNKAIKHAEKILARSQEILNEAQTDVAQKEADLAKLEAEVTSITSEQYETSVKRADIGPIFAKYIAYSSGRDKLLERGMTDIVSQIESIPETATAEEFKEQLKGIATQFEEFSDDYSNQLGEATNQVIKDILAQLKSGLDADGNPLTPEQTQKYVNDIKNAAEKDRAIYDKGSAEGIREALEKEQGIKLKDEQAFVEFEADFNELKRSAKDTRKGLEAETGLMSDAIEGLKERAEKNQPDFAENFVNLSNGIASATTALMTFKGIFDVWSNSDMSFGDKLLSTFMSITTAVSGVISAIGALQKVNLASMVVSAKDTVIALGNAAAHFLSAKARDADAMAAKLNTKATQKQTQTQMADTVAENASEGFKSGGKTISENGGKIIGKTAKTGGKAITTIGGALKAIAAVAVPIAIAAAAIAGTVAIIVNVYQAAEKTAKKAEEQAESVRVAAAEAKQEYQEAIDTIGNYQNALDGIEKLTKGTQEWRDAIAESNTQARELIDKFGKDLQASDYYFEDGQIKFKEGVLESLQEKEYNAMMQAQAGADSANIIAQQRRNEADKIAFARKNMKTGQGGNETAWSIGGGTAGGVVAGAALGSLFGIGIGTLIGAGVGAAVGAIGGAIGTGIAGAASEEEQEAIDKLAELYRKDSTIIDQMAQAQKSGQLNEFAEKYGISEELVNSLLKNKGATEELIIQMAANVNEMQLLRESIAANANVGKTAYDNAENQEYINARIANLMKDPDSKEYQAAQAKIDKLSNEDLYDLYLSEVMGDNENYRVINQGGKGATLQKKDENGNWVTDETLGKNGLIKADAIEALRNVLIADLSSKTIKKFDVEAQELVKSLLKSGISDKEIAKRAVKAQESGEAIDLSSLTKSQLEALKIDSIVNEKLAAAIEDAQENALTSWKNMLRDFNYFTQEAINQLDSATFGTTEQFTRQQLEAYGTALDQLTRIGGDGVAQAFNNNLTQLLDTNKDAAHEIMEVIMGIDWSKPEEGLWAFQNGLSDIGVYIDVMSWNVDELGKKFGDIDFSPAFLNSMDSIIQTLGELTSLSEIKIGDIIGEELYNALSEVKKGQFVEVAPKVVLQNGKFIHQKQYARINESDQAQQDIYKQAILDYDEKEAMEEQSWYKYLYSNENGDINFNEFISSLRLDPVGQKALNITEEDLNTWVQNYEDALDKVDDATSKFAGIDISSIPKEYLEYDSSGNVVGVDTDKIRDEIQINQTVLDTPGPKNSGPLEKQIKKLREYGTLGASYNAARNKVDEATIQLAESTMPLEIDKSLLGTSYTAITDEEITNYQEWLASSATSIAELQGYVEEGYISETLMNKYLPILQNQLKSLKDQVDIYEDEEAQIKSINRQLEEQQEITEKLHGKEKLQSLKKELGLNKQLLSVNEKGLEVAKQDLENERDKFEEEATKKWGEDFTKLIKRDKFGNIINWEQLRSYLLYEEGETATSIFDEYRESIIRAEEKVDGFTNSIKENHETINSYWGSQAEIIAENYDFISGKQEELKAQVENYRNIIGLIGKETLGIDNKTLKEINDSMTQISAIELQSSYSHYLDQQKNREKAEQAYFNNRNATTKEALEKAQAEEAQALAEMNNQWAAALEQASQALQDNISLIMESFEESLLGIGRSFEKMSEVYDQQSQISDQYLADYKKAYELNKLSRNIQNSIDNSSNIKSKQMLNDLQSELNTLQENGVKMSEYDLQYLQKKYDLRVAEIALEEAQNAKSQVRLQKMADGSWGYVYTQNEEAIDKTQQEYEDKLFNLQDLNNSYLDTVSQQILSIQSEFEADIMKIYGMGLSPDEQKKRIDETAAYYQTRLGFLTTEFDKVIEHNQNLQDMVQTFEETLLGKYIYEDYDSAKNIYDTFEQKVNGENGLLTQLENASIEYGKTINKFFDTTNTSIDDFSKKIMKNITNIQLSIANLNKAYDKNLFESTTTAVHGAISQLEVINALITKGHSFNALSVLTEKELADLYLKNFGSPKDIFGWNMKYVGKVSKEEPSNYADVAFASGGYTGEWGPEGRLAMLHEKELVLNAADTQNLLHIMKIMDRVIQNIDLSASAAASSRIHSPGIASMNSTLEQQVTIHAEFPNATNHSEIEQAFDTLINRATQYSNRR